jgi:hypothetical protein
MAHKNKTLATCIKELEEMLAHGGPLGMENNPPADAISARGRISFKDQMAIDDPSVYSPWRNQNCSFHLLICWIAKRAIAILRSRLLYANLAQPLVTHPRPVSLHPRINQVAAASWMGLNNGPLLPLQYWWEWGERKKCHQGGYDFHE